jgi:hypothetical protein
MAANPYPDLDAAVPETLADRLAEGALSLEEAIHLAIRIGESLREIHRQGRVYGRLQPKAIAIIAGEARLLPAGPAAPTQYSSPEQVAGNDLDWRSDIFSLGAVMYEMFSGLSAFRATSRAALHLEIPSREAVALDYLRPAVARLIRGCLEKRPERRIQRLEILLAELKLQHALTPEQAGGRPVSRPALVRVVPELGVVDRSAGKGAATFPDREKLDLVCPICGARDVHSSPPRGLLEAVLASLGISLGRCYRCYHRFVQVAGLTFTKQRGPTGPAA